MTGHWCRFAPRSARRRSRHCSPRAAGSHPAKRSPARAGSRVTLPPRRTSSPADELRQPIVCSASAVLDELLPVGQTEPLNPPENLTFMRLSRLLAVAIAAAAFAAVAPSANAASDYFLKVDGITGDTVQTGLTGYIDIDTFKWSTEQLATISTTGGMTAGKAQFNELEVTKPVDTTTPLLFQKLASGQVINTVEVLARKTATAPYLRYCF